MRKLWSLLGLAHMYPETSYITIHKITGKTGREQCSQLPKVCVIRLAKLCSDLNKSIKVTSQQNEQGNKAKALGLFHVLFGVKFHIHQWFKTFSLPLVLEKYKQQNKHSQSYQRSSNCRSNHGSPRLAFFKRTWKHKIFEVKTDGDFISQIMWKEANFPQPAHCYCLCI